MDFLQAFWLAVVQGLTEFLPISSSAHLILPSAILGWQDQGLAFDVAVHVGSLIAVLAYFKKDVAQLIQSWVGATLLGVAVMPKAKWRGLLLWPRCLRH